MVFIFDLDDTICETDEYSTKYILEFFKSRNLPFKQVCNVSRFAEKKFDWDNEIALDWYMTYGDKMMSEFPCKPNSVEIINNLYDLGHTVIFATARSNDWHNKPEEVTIEWLKNNQIKYHKLYIGRVDKEKICEQECADVFVDDDISITARVAEHNPKTKVFLSSTDFNRTQDAHLSVKRIECLQEIIDELFGESEFV